MNLSSVHHIAIICSSEAAAREFYIEKLGFPLLRQLRRPERGDTILWLGVDEHTELELFILDATPPPRPSYPEACGLRHLAFRVESCAQAIEWLAQRGIRCEEPRIDPVNGRALTFFADPDGLPIELHE